jgi:hypothetical protein
MKKLFVMFILIIFMTGFSSAYQCYQEYANRTSSCGGLATGSYNYNPVEFTNPNNMFDGNWGSFGVGNPGAPILRINYTKPAYAVGAIFMYKTNLDFINSTIPANCFSGISDRIVLNFAVGNNIDASCFDTESTNNGFIIGSPGATDFYEDGIFWEISPYPLFWNSSVYETTLQQFIIFINDSASVSSAYLNYSGTLTTASVLNLAGTSTITANKYISSSDVGSNNISFIVNFMNGSTYRSVNFTQHVLPISFGLCNATLNTKFLNITFKNETTSVQRVNAALTANIYYSLSDVGQVNKTYSMINSTEYSEYDFCFSLNQSLDTNAQFQYYNSESLVRSYTLESILTNVQSQLTLFLLPSSSGIYSRYKTITSSGTVIPGVLATVKRTISGTVYTIGTGLTDSAGQVVFFLNPDATYDYTFSKEGFSSSSFSLNPNSLETYTITLGGGVSTYNYTKIGNNLSYSIVPSQSNLSNASNVGFIFTVSGTNITFISMNITNISGSQLFYGTLASQGSVSQTVHIGNNTDIIGYFKIIAGGETFTVNKKWTVYNVFVGDYSIYKQLTLFNDYDFSPIFRILIMLAVFLLVGVMLSSDKPFEDNASQITVYILLVWAFSIVGWMNTGIAAGSNILSQSANQYGIALLTTVAGVAIIFRREWS